MTSGRRPRLAVVDDPSFDAHAPQGFHPERPERLVAARAGVARFAGERVEIAPREANRDELERVHDRAYLDGLEASLRRGHGYLDGDTYFAPGSHRAAWTAAGSGCALVDALLADRADVGILLARPPGHHALPGRAMGFCLLNNIAVAAAHARAAGVRRVAIVDWDVHHGNGTEAMFARDADVLFVSLHQSPLYPGSGAASYVGEGDARGRTVNVPLPPGSGPDVYAVAFERVVLPIVAAHRPDLVLVSAGYDAHARDPLASMRLDADAYRWMAHVVRSVTREDAHGRVALFLEGGYDLTAVEESVLATLEGLTGDAPAAPDRPGKLVPPAEAAIAQAAAAQKPFWPELR